MTNNKINSVSSDSSDSNPILSQREIEVLELIAAGLNNHEIGSRLHISHRTVDTHRTNMLKKLKAANSASLVRIGFQLGLIS